MKKWHDDFGESLFVRGNLKENEYNFLTNERRRHLRKAIQISTQLTIGLYLDASGHTKDISLGGACIEVPHLFAIIRPEKAEEILGINVTALIPSEDISFQGKIVRVDPIKDELAIAISEVSDEKKWKKLSAE